MRLEYSWRVGIGITVTSFSNWMLRSFDGSIDEVEEGGDIDVAQTEVEDDEKARGWLEVVGREES